MAAPPPNSAPPPQVLQWLHRVIAPSYLNPQRTYSDVATCLATIPTLAPRTSVYTYENGKSELLLHLFGTLPVMFRGATYNIPFAIWVPFEYPKIPPMAFVTPAEGMMVRPGNHVDTAGKCYHPYLANWVNYSERSNLVDLCDVLRGVFGREPPVVAKTAPPQPSNEPIAPPPRPPLPPELAPRSPVATPPPSKQGPPPLPPLPREFVEQQDPRRMSMQHMPPPHSVSGLANPPAHAPHRGSISGSAQAPTPPHPAPVAVNNPPAHFQQPPRPPQTPVQSAHPSYQPQTSPNPPPQSQHFQPQHPPPPFHPRALDQRPLPPGPPPPPPKTQTPTPRNEPPLPPLPPGARPIHDRNGPPLPPLPREAEHAPPPRPVSYHAAIPPAQQPLPPTPAPPTDLLDTPSPPPAVASPAPGPAPAPPPNPEKDILTAKIASSLSGIAESTLARTSTALSSLSVQRTSLLAAQSNLEREVHDLNHISQMCDKNAEILKERIAAADKVIAECKQRELPDVDAVVVAGSVLENQMYELVAEEAAISDTIWVLARALDKGREGMGLEVFLKHTRILAREQFMKKALIVKIKDEMGLS
ncbi:UEV domain-containing protein [Pyronema omphalodes]|nr:UEV domain-containing protein [Pyronema omphalodes]